MDYPFYFKFVKEHRVKAPLGSHYGSSAMGDLVADVTTYESTGINDSRVAWFDDSADFSHHNCF